MDGQSLYSFTRGGETVVGPLVYHINNNYYSSCSATGNEDDSYNPPNRGVLNGSDEAVVVGSSCTVGTTNRYNYQTFIIRTGNTYELHNGSTVTPLTSVEETSNLSSSDRVLYSYTTEGGATGSAVMAVFQISGVFNLYHKDNSGNIRYLRIERRARQLLGYVFGYNYSLWCAMDSEHNALGNTYSTNKDGYITFNE